ncbi:MAG: alpha/beta hydrolase [Acidimicrobiaceae bacterium]|nr:alpha/beta hydrolase [Acidimicrobiaceae bacterium]
MPFADLDPTLSLYYEDDCFVEPWLTPDTVMLVHGNAESSVAWYGWMTELTARFRVLRPDLRGLGRSSAPSADYEYSTEGLALDLVHLLDALEIDSVHLVGAKFGGTVAAYVAATYPQRVSTLSLMTALIPVAETGSRLEPSSMSSRVETIGHTAFVAESERLRLGSQASEEQVRWWSELMSSHELIAPRVLSSEFDLDMRELLPRITAPTLVVTTDGNAIARLESVMEWQRLLPHSQLLVLPSDGFHVAAIYPGECARQVVDFIARQNQSSLVRSAP